MTEVNSVDLLRKTATIDDVEIVVEDQNSEENKATEQTTNIFVQGEDQPAVTSPIKAATVQTKPQEDKPKEDKPIELAKTDDKDIGLDTFERTTEEKNTEKPKSKSKKIKAPRTTKELEKLSHKDLANEKFITACIGQIPNLDPIERPEMRKKIENLLDEMSKLPNSEDKQKLVARFIADNGIAFDEKKLSEVIDMYYRNIDSPTQIDKGFLTNGDTKILIQNKPDVQRHLSAREIEIINNKQKALKAIAAERNVYQLGKLEQYADSQIMSCISSADSSISDEELAEMLAALKYDLQHASSSEEAAEIAAKFAKDTRIKFDLPKFEKLMFEYAEKEGFSKENVQRIAEKFGDMRTFQMNVALKMLDENDEKTRHLRELLVKAFQLDIPEAHENIKNMIFECLNDAYTEEEIAEIIEQLEVFVETHTKGIDKAVAEGDFSDSFKEYVSKQNKKIIEDAKKRTQEYIQAFFETELGQTIKKQAKYAIQEVREAKLEFEECKENTAKAQEEAQEAKAASEKAMKEAKEEQKKAEAIAARFGFKDLDFKSLYKVVKQESPRQANNLLYAQANKKKAYWAEYDANVAQHHAEFLEGLAKKHFEFAQMKVAAAFAKMQAMMSAQG